MDFKNIKCFSKEASVNQPLQNVTFNVLFESMPDALVIVDRKGIIVEINMQAEKLFGYSREEILNKPVEILVPLKSRSLHHKQREQYQNNPTPRYMGTRISLTAAHKNGEIMPVDISLNPLHIKDESFIIAAVRDISEIIKAHEEAIEGWSRAMDFRDKETERHTQRVAEILVELATEMGLSDFQIRQARQGALLHDIGKMAIPDRILLKPGPLTDEEWVIMRKHPEIALEMLWPINFLRPASLDIPYCHHEKWDGTGYPRGIKGEEIPFAARIFSVIDVWDALSYSRPYREAWEQEQVINHIKDQMGKHFDPKVADVFLKTLPKILEKLENK